MPRVISLLISLLALWCSAVASLRADTQDPLRTVAQLYFAASYEEALAELDRIEGAIRVETTEASEYRILCLLALGRVEGAQLELENLLRRTPDYRPDPERASPRLQKQFAIVQRRLLSETIRASYANARHAFDAKHYEDAALQFDRLLNILRDADEPELAELRALAADFLELARNATQAVASATVHPPADRRFANAGGVSTVASRSAGTSDPAQTRIFDIHAADVVPPTPLGPILPQASPEPMAPQRPGLFEIVIDERGIVESAAVRRSINARYDALVIADSRNWRFKPATRGGQPVKFRKLIEISAVALPPS
jgi:tetratricopeptide (TPR) repeat protein